MVIDMVVELSGWVAAAGLRKLLILNAHGGNVAPLAVAVDEIRRAGLLQVGCISWFELSPEILERTFADGQDIHANAAETSLMLHLHPELRRHGRDPRRPRPHRRAGVQLPGRPHQRRRVDGLPQPRPPRRTARSCSG